MDLIKEYISRKLSAAQLEEELLKLIIEYNKSRGTYLFIYAAAIGKPIPQIPLEQGDYFTIRDMLKGKNKNQNVDIYLETPGGRGETAEEIVEFLHDNFEKVSFLVSGEAKSAGTLMVMSGDEIWMTESGSLGPIDAQIKIGRSVISAYDYMEWIEEKRMEAEKSGALNPFDATMIAQISPGELGNVYHALKFAEDLVAKWLKKYKFKSWDVTETRKTQVTDEMKEKRATEIAKALYERSEWRTHGRSIKIKDLEKMGVRIKKVSDFPEMENIVYRIQTVCRMLFDSTSAFKIFATQDNKIFRSAAPVGSQVIRLPSPAISPQQKQIEAVELEHSCNKCGNAYKIYAKFVSDPKIDEEYKKKGYIPFPKDGKLSCICNFEMDLSGIKNQIEIQTGKRLIIN